MPQANSSSNSKSVDTGIGVGSVGSNNHMAANSNTNNGNSNTTSTEEPIISPASAATTGNSPVINPHRNQFNLLPHQTLPQGSLSNSEKVSNPANSSSNNRKSLNPAANSTTNNKIKPKKKPQLQKSPSYYLNNPSHSHNHNQIHSINSASSLSLKSCKYVYSVDDDTDEIEQDMEREYLEGYNDALRYRLKRSSRNLKDYNNQLGGVTSKTHLPHDQQPTTSNTNPNHPSNLLSQQRHPTTSSAIQTYNHTVPSNTLQSNSAISSSVSVGNASNSNAVSTNTVTKTNIAGDIEAVKEEIYQDLKQATFNLHRLEDIEGDSLHTGNSDTIIRHIKHHNNSLEDETEGTSNGEQCDDDEQEEEEEQQDNHLGDFAEDDYESEDPLDTRSISSTESYTLRERQAAINTTHPFGIRIWKPAIYKKIRSVEKEADVDIHEVDDGRRRKISWEVHLANCLWAVTFGVMLFLVCFFGSVLLILTGSLNYSTVLFKLGIYLLWPFGKLVYLQQDENYLSEDRNDGTTFGEYARWRDEEMTKLFFSASRPNDGLVQGGMESANFAHSTDHIPTLKSLAKNNNITPPIASSSSVQPARPSPLASNRLPEDHQADDQSQETFKKRFFGRGDWNLGRIIFYMFFYLILYPFGLFVWIACWLMVFTIPMAKVLQTLAVHLRKHPLALFFRYDIDTRINTGVNLNRSNVLICTYRSSGLHYYKYTVEGTNIFFINLMAVVFFTIFAFYGMKEFLSWENILTDDSVIFALCLLSIIPLAYFIGQAVASISAQSSMGLGAVINAFFSTVVEIFLYCVALDQNKGQLVEGSMIGSILGAVLLLPGLSMCAGALKRKTQRYNPASAGVSSTMLIFSVMVMLSPTFFFQIYGSYEVECKPCVEVNSSSSSSCQSCHFYQPPVKLDSLFYDVLKPFSVICAVLLFTAYIVGLWFTLRTHAALIWETPITAENKKQQQQQLQHMESSFQLTDSHQENPQPNTEIIPAAAAAIHAPVEQSGGHDAPNWSKNKSTFVLLTATLLYAIIAEILVDCVDSVLSDFPQLDPKFLGITIFALVPNTTEFLNAISFARNGNVALSMEIGSAYALQVVLIQIPSLVLYSLYFIDVDSVRNVKESMFTLFFPKWDLFTSVISVMLFTYIYGEGKSNYFKGTILILGYVVCVMGFFFVSVVKEENFFGSSAIKIILPIT